jgi:hypothetical protein
MTKSNDEYLGNRNLKKSYVPIEWSQEKITEFLKCSKDPEYFISNYVKIINVDKGLIQFEPFPYQKDIINLATTERFVICKMPRQVGKTTVTAAIILWYVLFNSNYSVAILANKEAQAIEILGRVQLAYEHLPKWLQQGIVEWNKKSVELENGSKIVASSTASNAIRGTSQNLVYLDEFAFVANHIQESFFSSVYPTISSGLTTKVLITSTPNGLNLFYKLWRDSEQGRNSYHRIDVHWSDVPGRDEKWREETIRNTSERQFKQEFECEFLGSSNTLIDGSKLRTLVYEEPIKRQGDIKIYAESIVSKKNPPQTGRLYAITVDTSRGLDGDYSAFIVFDITAFPYTIAATYKNNLISAQLFPNFVKQAADYYNNAIVLVETNDIGGQVADILHDDLEYENVLFTSSSKKNGQYITMGFSSGSVKGVRTTTLVKRVGCANLKTLIEMDKLIVNDFELIEELSRFSQKGNSFEAEEGHDDLVMCCVVFAWMTTQQYFKEHANSNLRQNLYNEQQNVIEEELTPFGLIDEGEYEENPPLLAVDNDYWLVKDELNSNNRDISVS